jgi:hypothetical protein
MTTARLKHSSDKFSGAFHIRPPKKAGIFKFKMVRTYAETTELSGSAYYDECIKIGKAQGKSRPPSGMAFSIFTVIVRLERTDHFTHQREIAGQGSNGKDQRLRLVIPGKLGSAIFHIKQSCKATASSHVISAIQQNDFSFGGCGIY